MTRHDVQDIACSELTPSPNSPIIELVDEKDDNSAVKYKEDKTRFHEDFREVSYIESATPLGEEPVIHDGRDVSRYQVDVRDDGDPALTFRSLFLGTVFAGLGAALCQVHLRSISTSINRL